MQKKYNELAMNNCVDCIKRLPFYPEIENKQLEFNPINILYSHTNYEKRLVFKTNNFSSQPYITLISKLEYKKNNYDEVKFHSKENIVDLFINTHEIRFLDKTINMIKTTFQNNNGIEQKDFLWGIYILKSRTDYFKTIVKFLQFQMQTYQETILNIQNKLDLMTINVATLKKNRNESRNKAKLEWYIYRNIQENNFIKILQDYKHQLLNKKTYNNNEIEKLKQSIKLLKDNIEIQLKKKEILNQSIAHSNRRSIKNSYVLKNKLINEVNKFENLKKHKEILQIRANENNLKKLTLINNIRELTIEIEHLNSIILGKNADDTQLQKLKDYNKMYEDIFKIQLINAEEHKITLKLCSFVFIFYINDNGIIINATVQKSDIELVENIYDMFFIENIFNSMPCDNLKQTESSFVDTIFKPEKQKRLSISTNNKEKFINSFQNHTTLDTFIFEKLHNITNENIINDFSINLASSIKLKDIIHDILLRYCIINNLMKEISMLKKWVKIETFYVQRRIYLRFYLKTFDIKFDTLDLTIDNHLQVYCNKVIVIDLKKKINGLTNYIKEYINH